MLVSRTHITALSSPINKLKVFVKDACINDHDTFEDEKKTFRDNNGASYKYR